MKKILLAATLVLLGAGAEAQVCMGSGPGCPGGGGGISTITSGTTPTSGCSAGGVLYSISNLVKCNGAFTFDDSILTLGSVTTAGRATIFVQETISGSSTTSNFLRITGTTPTTLTANVSGANFQITTGGSSSFTLTGLNLNLLAGYTGSSRTQGARFESAVASSGAVASLFASSGGNAGVFGYASAGTSRVGVQGLAATGGTTGIGVIGTSSGGTATRVGGYFTLDNTGGTGTVGLVGDNGAVAGNPFEARDNGTLPSTNSAAANFAVLDGAQVRLGPNALTSATMNATIVSEARSVAHSYAWTNAMVVALGATGTGDITVATIPAKTRVDSAYVVIDTPDSSANALTVSCGDAIGGAPFNNYVVASDAKAAANTVYGDLISGAETGTALFDATTKWFTNYVPSYASTTLVTCRFTKTATNLDTVTGSTGRVILTTTLLP